MDRALQLTTIAVVGALVPLLAVQFIGLDVTVRADDAIRAGWLWPAVTAAHLISFGIAYVTASRNGGV